MFRPGILLGAAALLISACATTSSPSPPSPGSASCDAAKAQFAVGRPYSEALADEAKRAAGAQLVRKKEPGKAYTLEFLDGRLNLEVDTADRVTAVRCG